jgi:hypothetical protein
VGGAGASTGTTTARALGSRGLQVVAVVAYFQLGMHGIGALSAGREAHVLATPLDAWVPFVPWTVYPYSAAYPLALLPLFVVRCPRLFRRTLAACVAVLTASFAVYLAFPVTSLGLRPDLSGLDPRVLHHWGLALTYRVDPPYNLFPSLHLSMATLAALAAYEAVPLAGWLASPLVVGVAVGICTTKQHFVADGVAGLLLALGVWRGVLVPYRAEAAPAEERAFGPGGGLAFLGLFVLFFGAMALVHAATLTK